MRNLRAAVFIAWVLCALVSAAALISTINTLVGSWSADQSLPPAGDVLFNLLPVMFAIPAALIISRHPRNTIGWLMMTPGLVMVISGWIDLYLGSFKTAPPPATLPILLLLILTSASWIGFIFPTILIPLFFPTGRLLSPHWRWVIYLAVGLVLFFFFWAGFTRETHPDFASWTIINPVGFISDKIAQAIMLPWTVMLALLTIVSLASIVIRYRRAEVVEREQMKWLLYACCLFAFVYVCGFIFETGNYRGTLGNIFNLLFALSIIAIPAAITIAILRYHLFDIDVIIRLTLVYALVTALLGLVYVGGVALLQALFRNLTGQTSDLAVLLTTLAIATLFSPLRQSIQAMINRRFYRQKYNADQALAQFASAARGGSDLDALNNMLIDLVVKTLQPTQAHVVMRTARPGQAGGSKENIFR